MKPIAQQIILVTGSTDGLGKQTALALARQGATVLLHGRNQQRLEKTLRDIQDMTGNRRLETYLANLADLSEVRSLAARVQTQHPQLDMLINNAGVGSGKLLGGRRELSRDGYELRFAVNYLAPFLLTHLLLPNLRVSPPSRIIHVGSVGQRPIDFDDIMCQRRYNGEEPPPEGQENAQPLSVCSWVVSWVPGWAAPFSPRPPVFPAWPRAVLAFWWPRRHVCVGPAPSSRRRKNKRCQPSHTLSCVFDTLIRSNPSPKR